MLGGGLIGTASHGKRRFPHGRQSILCTPDVLPGTSTHSTCLDSLGCRPIGSQSGIEMTYAWVSSNLIQNNRPSCSRRAVTGRACRRQAAAAQVAVPAAEEPSRDCCPPRCRGRGPGTACCSRGPAQGSAAPGQPALCTPCLWQWRHPGSAPGAMLQLRLEQHPACLQERPHAKDMLHARLDALCSGLHSCAPACCHAVTGASLYSSLSTQGIGAGGCGASAGAPAQCCGRACAWPA